MACYGAADNSVVAAVDGSKFLVGVTQIVGADKAGDQVDICRDDLPEVQYGGIVAKGDPLTADADGKAIKAQAGNYILGYAEMDGVEDDIGLIFISPDKL
jgi:hypothetical protein